MRTCLTVTGARTSPASMSSSCDLFQRAAAVGAPPAAQADRRSRHRHTQLRPEGERDRRSGVARLLRPELQNFLGILERRSLSASGRWSRNTTFTGRNYRRRCNGSTPMTPGFAL
ncbi:hypothetical protein WMY93_032653 [Mugilogobius chulae]|uniref:Uncharacterized protein n=1 Tax=Mugilogobius chulae TaxID=88201 RepID=A0AAW0MU42_9GOBI